MSTLDDIAQERQRLAERLAKLDGEREKLAEQLAELEAAERVFARFTQAPLAGKRRGRRPAISDAEETAVPRRGGRPRRPAAARQEGALSLGDATLQAVAAHADGVSADAVRSYLADHFGMQVRPNHLGMALQRHRRAGRLEQRDHLWFSPAPPAAA
jgi:hypothetical protein